jgi:YD repeat-containing protein
MNEIRDYQWDIDLDSKIDMTEHYYTVDYVYNDKDQLIKKVFKLQLKTYTDSYDLPDHDLTIEKTKETPIETYTYDDAGNLTSVYTYLNPEKTVLAYSEDYFYNDNNQLVRLLRRKATGMMGAFNRHFKRLNEFFFNDKGDVIQINSYENDEKTIHATYFYEYSGYDKYDNWTHMEMRIKDVPTKEPTMVADRIIEYYEE